MSAGGGERFLDDGQGAIFSPNPQLTSGHQRLFPWTLGQT
jgi:hypothetical protein